MGEKKKANPKQNPKQNTTATRNSWKQVEFEHAYLWKAAGCFVLFVGGGGWWEELAAACNTGCLLCSCPWLHSIQPKCPGNPLLCLPLLSVCSSGGAYVRCLPAFHFLSTQASVLQHEDFSTRLWLVHSTPSWLGCIEGLCKSSPSALCERKAWKMLGPYLAVVLIWGTT